MAEHQPLLAKEQNLVDHGGSKPTSFLRSLARLLLKSLMWLIFILWVVVIFFFPTHTVMGLFSRWAKLTESTLFGITGSIFLGFSGPILVITLLAFVYIIAFPRCQFEYAKNSGKLPRFRLWTFPVIVDGPFGVVSAAEFIGVLLFSIYILWTVTARIIENQSTVSMLPLPSNEKLYFFLEITGAQFGSIGLFCLVFLFLPVARGSILLRLIDIPFEHATRYHVWLGHLTMVIFTIHGLLYVAAWALQGRLLQQLLEWKEVGVANLPGVISLLAGLFMWVTSFHPVRKNYFELFFYTHQLYVIFVIFLALHVGDFVFSIAAAAIFLFVLDRFLRFCQSRTNVDVLSAVCRPCGTVELVFSKPASLRYNALSFIFLQVRELSWLQWHPFSVSSSPMDGSYHLSILIKVLGEWTDKLCCLITDSPEQQESNINSKANKITASIEGPYGHEVPYHLMYKNLILVAGGIGITPFLAIISDICRRINEGKPCLPQNVLVIWSVKKSKELSLLSVLNEQCISSSCFDKLHLDLLAYVTQESEPPLEEGNLVHEDVKPASIFTINGKSMSCLVGTGNTFCSAIYYAVSTLGFILLFGLVEKYYIGPFGIYAWWYRGLLFTLCMVAGAVVFGGIVLFLWNHWEKNSGNAKWIEKDENKSVLHNEESTLPHVDFTSMLSPQYGRRPDFHDLFSLFVKEKEFIDVGVIVCGPPGLQTSVAKEVRSLNIKRKRNQAVFHFNSHSFDF
ncbi:ferric reduction oxidase 7, chloroplastic-like isoform X1 [Zingiber officinale]|uniref:ferric reduction oxidase 7, chloroplastic-like isoform X1 n=1 Tax=Zingiber officinale TaxID=94328 RepID=UPI001C4D8951|nr:ferric reduction oxidase 7, chloroplastic-like isoform X1 [Zingiber officinale]